MTLLESVIAFVLLAVVGVSCLELTRGAASLQRSSAAWTAAVAAGESALASAVAGAPPDDALPATVLRTRWRDGVERVEVTVALPDGRAFRLNRLVPAMVARQ